MLIKRSSGFEVLEIFTISHAEHALTHYFTRFTSTRNSQHLHGCGAVLGRMTKVITVVLEHHIERRCIREVEVGKSVLVVLVRYEVRRTVIF